MKKLAIVVAGAALAMASSLHAAEPAPAPAQPAVKQYTTQETTIETLLADPAAKAVIDKHIPGLSSNPQIGMAGAMTLAQISQMAPDQIKPETLSAIDADLAKLPAK